MRTTLDIDERALAAARAKAASEGISLGRAVSDLILTQAPAVVPPDGFPIFPSVAGHVITPEMVEELRDDE